MSQIKGTSQAAAESAGSDPSPAAPERQILGNLIEGLICHRAKAGVSEVSKLPIGTEPQDLRDLIRVVEARGEALAPERATLGDRAWQTYRAMSEVAAQRRVISREEKALEDFLAKDGNLALLEPAEAGEPELVYIARQVVTASGTIDIQAQKGSKPVTVELKARKFDVADTTLQLTKYLHDRTNDRLIFVAPKIPATLFFNLKPFFDAGRISYVEVTKEAHNYRFRKVAASEFTEEAMEKEIARGIGKRRAQQPASGLVRVLKPASDAPNHPSQKNGPETTAASAPPEQDAVPSQPASESSSPRVADEPASTSLSQNQPPADTLAAPEGLFPSDPQLLLSDADVASVCLEPFRRGGSPEDRRLVLSWETKEPHASANSQRIELCSWRSAPRLNLVFLLSECAKADREGASPDKFSRLCALVERETSELARQSKSALDTSAKVLAALSKDASSCKEAAFLHTQITQVHRTLQTSRDQLLSMLDSTLPNTAHLVVQAKALVLSSFTEVHLLQASALQPVSPRAACLYLAGARRDIDATDLINSASDTRTFESSLRSCLVQDEQRFAAICETLNLEAAPLSFEPGLSFAENCRQHFSALSFTRQELLHLQGQVHPATLPAALFAANELAGADQIATRDLPISILSLWYRRAALPSEHSLDAEIREPRYDRDLLRQASPRTVSVYLSNYNFREALRRDAVANRGARSNLKNSCSMPATGPNARNEAEDRAEIKKYYSLRGFSSISSAIAIRGRTIARIAPALAAEYLLHPRIAEQSSLQGAVSELLQTEQKLFEDLLGAARARAEELGILIRPERPGVATSGLALRELVNAPSPIEGAAPRSGEAKFRAELEAAIEKLKAPLDRALSEAEAIGVKPPSTRNDLSAMLGAHFEPAARPAPNQEVASLWPHEILSELSAILSPARARATTEELTKLYLGLATSHAQTAQRSIDQLDLVGKVTTPTPEGSPAITSIFGQAVLSHLVVQHYLEYRIDAVRLLQKHFPERLSAYLAFAPKAYEAMCPGESSRANLAMPSALEQLKRGNPGAASMLQGFISADFRLLSQLIEDGFAERFGAPLDFGAAIAANSGPRVISPLPDDASLLISDAVAYQQFVEPFITKAPLSRRREILSPEINLTGEQRAAYSGRTRLQAESLLKELQAIPPGPAPFQFGALKTLCKEISGRFATFCRAELRESDWSRRIFRALEDTPPRQAEFLVAEFQAAKRSAREALIDLQKLNPDSLEADLGERDQGRDSLQEKILKLDEAALRHSEYLRLGILILSHPGAACIYAAGIRRGSQTAVVPASPADGSKDIRAESLRENQLFESIAEALCLRGQAPEAPSELIPPLDELLARQQDQEIPEASLEELERRLFSEQHRFITAAARELESYASSAPADKMRLFGVLPGTLKGIEQHSNPLLVIGDMSVVDEYSARLSAPFLLAQLERRAEVFRFHAHHHTTQHILPSIGSMGSIGSFFPTRTEVTIQAGGEYKLDASPRVLALWSMAELFEAAKLFAQKLSKFSPQLAVRYLLDSGLLIAKEEAAAEHIRREWDIRLQIVLALSNKVPPAASRLATEKSIEETSGEEIRERAGNARAAKSEVRALPNDMRAAKIRNIQAALAEASRTLDETAKTEMSSALPGDLGKHKGTKPQLGANRGSSANIHDVLLSHEVENRLQRDLDDGASASSESTEKTLRHYADRISQYKRAAAEHALLAGKSKETESERPWAEVFARSEQYYLALEKTLAYRRACIELLHSVDPAGAREYIQFSLWSLELVFPSAIAKVRQSAPAITAAFHGGDPSTAQAIGLYLAADAKLFEELLNSAVTRAAAKHASSAAPQGQVSPRDLSPQEKLSASILTAGRVSLLEGQVFDAAQALLRASAKAAISDTGRLALAKALQAYKIPQTVGTAHGLTNFQAEIFLLQLRTDFLEKGTAPNQAEVKAAYEAARLRQPH